jgi:hypothetical protein
MQSGLGPSPQDAGIARQSSLTNADLGAISDEGRAGLERIAGKVTALADLADLDGAAATKVLEQAEQGLARLGFSPAEAQLWAGLTGEGG